MNSSSTARRQKHPIRRFYSLALSIPGMTRPVWCTVTACGRSDAQRQARSVVRRIKARIVPPAVLAILGLLAVGAPAHVGAQGLVYKSGVEMVALTVTVTDPKGQTVSGLSADSFAVFEDGVQQPVALFGSEDIPVDVGVMLDTSASMLTVLPVIKRAAHAVVDTLRPGDRAAVIELKDTTRMPQVLTDDLQRVGSAIDALSASGTTALYEGLYTALRAFERERREHPELRRQALVVLSDGLDTKSRLGFDDVLELARELDLTIYTIAPRTPTPTGKDHLAEAIRRANWEMRALATETGGRVFFPTQPAELQRIYDTIARELTSQYALGYVRSAHRQGGAFTRVALKLLPPIQGIARTRSGYLAKDTSGPGTTARGSRR